MPARLCAVRVWVIPVVHRVSRVKIIYESIEDLLCFCQLPTLDEVDGRQSVILDIEAAMWDGAEEGARLQKFALVTAASTIETTWAISLQQTSLGARMISQKPVNNEQMFFGSTKFLGDDEWRATGKQQSTRQAPHGGLEM